MEGSSTAISFPICTSKTIGPLRPFWLSFLSPAAFVMPISRKTSGPTELDSLRTAGL